MLIKNRSIRPSFFQVDLAEALIECDRVDGMELLLLKPADDADGGRLRASLERGIG
jgi:hypothetical protein